MQMTVLNGPSKILIVFCSHKFQTSFSLSWTQEMNHIPTVLITHCSGLGLPPCSYAEILSSNQKKKKFIFSKSFGYKNKILYKVGKLKALVWSKWICYLCAWGPELVVALMVGFDDLGGLSNFNNSILSSNWWLFWSLIPCTLNNLLSWGFCPTIPFLLWQSLQSFKKNLQCFPTKYFLRRKKIKYSSDFIQKCLCLQNRRVRNQRISQLQSYHPTDFLTRQW